MVSVSAMDPEALVRWALDDARTLEERYTTERWVEQGVRVWLARRGVYNSDSLDDMVERQRQRALNPAYQPRYTEEGLRRTAEAWAEMKSCPSFSSFNDRPLRNIAVFRFFPAIEHVSLHLCEVEDLSPLAEMPNLHTVHLHSLTCRDFRPLARCKKLRELHIKMDRHWPQVDGIADLPLLEELKLEGNLLVFQGAVFRHVISAALMCEPLAAQNVAALPQVPNCRYLYFGGIETLEGIEAFPHLRNVVLATPAESFEPLTALKELTCLTVLDHEPTDVSPLARVPKLQFVSLDTWNRLRVRPPRPRDVAPLVESLSLRELFVRGSKVIETEAAAVQAGLPSWNDLYLRPEPRPLPPLAMRALPSKLIPHDGHVPIAEPEEVDVGLRECELRWAKRQLSRAITQKLGTSDWGESKSDYPHMTTVRPLPLRAQKRRLCVEFHSFGLLDKYPLFIEAIRECLARFAPDYQVHIWNRLKAPAPPPSAAQLALEEKLSREEDDAEFERRTRENEAYIERLHRYELKKQEGGKVDPAEFAPEPQAAGSKPEDEDEENDFENEQDDFENDDDDDSGDVAVKEEEVETRLLLDDDEHPLAGNYMLMAELTLDTFYIPFRQRGVAEYLMRRPCDEVIEEEKEK